MAKAVSVLLQDLRDGRSHDDMTQKFAVVLPELDRPQKAIDDAFLEYVCKVHEAGFVALLGKA